MSKINKILTGLDRLLIQADLQDKIEGNIGYLCHAASIENRDNNYQIGIYGLQKKFQKRLKKLFGPQHGLVGDVQDNMIETSDFEHPYFKIPVHSLYGETRIPTNEMLKGLDTIIVDLQDVGTRIYTYIYTLTLLMEKCAKLGLKVVVLDRPNPIGGLEIEGNVLNLDFASFVGRHPLPVRHGLTIGEVALMAKKFWGINCELDVIKMQGWKRSMNFWDTGLNWVLPSPNLPTIESTFCFPGTVLFEGTMISEGRGSTRSLEIIGHPNIGPYAFYDKLKKTISNWKLEGFNLRPLVFMPTFQKFANQTCGGFQIHPTNLKLFKPWHLGQLLMLSFYKELKSQNHFKWKQPPYEYEYNKMPIDLINGTDRIRQWIEQDGTLPELKKIEQDGLSDYCEMRSEILLYS